MISAVLTFLMQHAELVELLFEAISKGLTKDQVAKAIKDAMVEAADAEMKKELG